MGMGLAEERSSATARDSGFEDDLQRLEAELNRHGLWMESADKSLLQLQEEKHCDNTGYSGPEAAQRNIAELQGQQSRLAECMLAQNARSSKIESEVGATHESLRQHEAWMGAMGDLVQQLSGKVSGTCALAGASMA